MEGELVIFVIKRRALKYNNCLLSLGTTDKLGHRSTERTIAVAS